MNYYTTGQREATHIELYPIQSASLNQAALTVPRCRWVNNKTLKLLSLTPGIRLIMMEQTREVVHHAHRVHINIVEGDIEMASTQGGGLGETNLSGDPALL